MAVVNLNNLQGLPVRYITRLREYDNIFKDVISIESLLDDSTMSCLIEEIDSYCRSNSIIGYHYTRAIPDEIASVGLISRKGTEIRNNFISKYERLFTKEELRKIKEAWDMHFCIEQQEFRDNLIFFNFTLKELHSFGSEPLLSNFGGEQIYMPLQEIDIIGDKIKNIGVPLILKCVLDPSNLHTFHEHPWGRIAISTYHFRINNDIIRDDQDGYQKVNVSPENIEIIYYSKNIEANL